MEAKRKTGRPTKEIELKRMAELDAPLEFDENGLLIVGHIEKNPSARNTRPVWDQYAILRWEELT